MRIHISTLFLLIGGGLFFAGCRLPATPTPFPSPQPNLPPPTGMTTAGTPGALALVESVEVFSLETFPVQVQVKVKGVTTEPCSELAETRVARIEEEFKIQITTQRLAGPACGGEAVPFEENIPLEVFGLPAGDYQVAVNGITAEFSLALDNRPAPEPPPVEAGKSALSGRVWHDLCRVAGDDAGEPAAPIEGCVQTTAGLGGNGRPDPGEPGVEGVVLNLGPGPCPSVGILTTLTDGDGAYRFSDLPAGTYCISIDTSNRINEPILFPGAWTTPMTDQAIVEQTVAVPEASDLAEVNFGWANQFHPEGAATAGCTDRLSFVEDVTVPDYAVLLAGQPFTKTWRLKNEGTCTWSPDYTLAFVRGEAMGGVVASALEARVPPGTTVDLSITLQAPLAPGLYRGFWQLHNPAGAPFGYGLEADRPFWVLIRVQAP